MHDDASGMRTNSVLEEINALPRSEQQHTVCNRNRQRRLRQRRLGVRGHIVGPFGAVNKKSIAVRDETLEKSHKIALHVRIGIFLDEK